jgi:hypothetical protein
MQIEPSLGEASACTQAAALKRRETPKSRLDKVGSRLCSKWLGVIPTTCTAKAQPVGAVLQVNLQIYASTNASLESHLGGVSFALIRRPLLVVKICPCERRKEVIAWKQTIVIGQMSTCYIQD